MLALPIDALLPEATRLLDERGALVVVAEPGAGKTTRLPWALCERGARVLVTQPRRIAARMAARRVAAERGHELGGQVGFQVRGELKTSAATRLTFATEGLALRQLASAGRLRDVDVLVLDEFHERHWQGDLLLALAKAQRAAGDPLRVVIMSATLDAAPVAAYLDAPVLQVPGRTYPVTIEHVEESDDRPLERRVASAATRFLADDSERDVLVFLPGAREIRRAAERCARVCKTHGAELHVLHGDLPAKAQDAVVRKGSSRKLILSTNIAESSVTLPDVTVVVDSGLVRRPSYSPFTGLSVLSVERVAQASAIQRSGRAGRVRAGRALRLYTQADFDRRPFHDPPEVARLDLAELVLTLHALGHTPREFDWLSAPPETGVAGAEALLRALTALDEGSEVTPAGRRMLGAPLHPRLARICLAAETRGVGARGAVLAALIGERDLVRRNVRLDSAITQSDTLARLEAFEVAEIERLRAHELAQRGLDPDGVRSVRDAVRQIRRALDLPGEPRASLVDEEEALTRALLAGFPDRVAQRRSGGRGGRRVRFTTGGMAELPEESLAAHATSDFLVVTEVSERREGAGKGRTLVRQATPISADDLLEVFGDAIVGEDEVELDATTGRVVGKSRLRYGELVLEESDGPVTDEEAAGRVLAGAVRERGLEKFIDRDTLEQWRRRIEFGRAQGLCLRSVDDDAIDEAVAACFYGRRSLGDIDSSTFFANLRGQQDHAELGRLEHVAPEAVSIPGRKRVPVSYEVDRDPWIASRLQDFCGLTDGPRIAEGRVALTLHLQAPNRRAVQVTTDLAGFWERHYPALRKELGRRYPRHPWPEDPTVPLPPRERRPPRKRKR